MVSIWNHGRYRREQPSPFSSEAREQESSYARQNMGDMADWSMQVDEEYHDQYDYEPRPRSPVGPGDCSH